MKNHAVTLTALFIAATTLFGCKSAVEKCKEESLKSYQAKVAACTDDDCKKALKDEEAWRHRYEEECLK